MSPDVLTVSRARPSHIDVDLQWGMVVTAIKMSKFMSSDQLSLNSHQAIWERLLKDKQSIADWPILRNHTPLPSAPYCA